MKARGKQDLWIKQEPEVLEVLREQAIIQSVESSNRIEGVTVAVNRLRPLVIGGAKPRDRWEEEISGYRAALNWIFARKNRLAITPGVIRRLHGCAERVPPLLLVATFVSISSAYTRSVTAMAAFRDS
jgi:hypothetical protein